MIYICSTQDVSRWNGRRISIWTNHMRKSIETYGLAKAEVSGEPPRPRWGHTMFTLNPTSPKGMVIALSSSPKIGFKMLAN